MTAPANPLQIVLSGICGVLLLVLIYQTVAPVSPYSMSASTTGVRLPAITFSTDAAPPPASVFSDVDARPLFNPSRQPVASVAAVGNAAGTDATNLTLIGVILDGNDRLALIRSAGAAFATGVRQGASIEGWTVAEVDPDRVVLQSGVRKQELLLASNRDTAPAGANSGGPGAAGPNLIPPPPPPSAPSGSIPLPQPVQTPDISPKPPLTTH